MNVLRFYSLYCVSILVAFVIAMYQGYAISSIFSNQQKADKSANHYHK